MKKLPRTQAAAGFLALLLALPALGDLPSLSYSGSTVGEATWNRPLASSSVGSPPTGLSNVGTAVPFLAQPFYVDQSGLYSFLSIANFPKAWDNFSFLYAGSFNPTAPLANVLIGNDDQPNIGQSGFNYNLTANSQYFFVITGFENSAFGTFTNTISGPGNVRLGSNARVPEAGSVLPAFAVVLAGLGFCHRLGKRSKAISA